MASDNLMRTCTLPEVRLPDRIDATYLSCVLLLISWLDFLVADVCCINGSNLVRLPDRIDATYLSCVLLLISWLDFLVADVCCINGSNLSIGLHVWI
jgi:hypothetical protein